MLYSICVMEQNELNRWLAISQCLLLYCGITKHELIHTGLMLSYMPSYCVYRHRRVCQWSLSEWRYLYRSGQRLPVSVCTWLHRPAVSDEWVVKIYTSWIVCHLVPYNHWRLYFYIWSLYYAIITFFCLLFPAIPVVPTVPVMWSIFHLPTFSFKEKKKNRMFHIFIGT